MCIIVKEIKVSPLMLIRVNTVKQSWILSKPYIYFIFSLIYISTPLCAPSRPVVPGGAGGAMTPPNFGRSVNSLSTKGGRLCTPTTPGTPGFSDLPTALPSNYVL
jgi:hypothetical protein